MPEKKDVFELPEVIAAIEKFDITVKQIVNSFDEEGLRFNLLSVFELLSEDVVLNFIMDQFFEDNAEQINQFSMQKYFSSKPRKRSDRMNYLFSLMVKFSKSGQQGFVSDFVGNGGTLRDGYLRFKTEVVGSFYRDITNMLIDLRVKAELSDDKEVKKEYVSFIFNGGKNQVNQNSTFTDTDITQKS